MPEIGLRKTLSKVVYDQLLNTTANLFLKEHVLSLLTHLKSSKLNPVYPKLWPSVLVATTFGSLLSFLALNIFPVSICQYIQRRITVMDISSWVTLPIEENLFIQTWNNHDNEFTWRRRKLTLLKKRSISSKLCPEWFALILWWMSENSKCCNGSNIWSGGKGLIGNTGLSGSVFIIYT